MNIFGGFRNILRGLMILQKFSFKSERFGMVLSVPAKVAAKFRLASRSNLNQSGFGRLARFGQAL